VSSATNSAAVSVGETYNDLGATITGPQADLNLGVKYFLNGTLASDIVLDTSAVVTDTIDYVATDPTGLSATSTRTIIVSAPATLPSAPTTPAASSTPAATNSLPTIDAPPLVPDELATSTVPSGAI
jgi:hypothetical protein